MASCRCCGLVAPTMGAVTPPWPSSQARAIWAGARCWSFGERDDGVDHSEVAVVVEAAGCRVGCSAR